MLKNDWTRYDAVTGCCYVVLLCSQACLAVVFWFDASILDYLLGTTQFIPDMYILISSIFKW